MAVSASFDKTLRIWDMANGRCLRTLKGHSDSVYGVALTVDGQLAVSASWDHTLRVWSLASGQCLRILEGHTDQINGVALTSDGRMAVSASFDRTLRLWDLLSGQCLALAAFNKPVGLIAIQGDNVVAGLWGGVAVLRLGV
jgi:WD40 repeat protein